EYLHAARKSLGNDDAVLLVDADPPRSHELPREVSLLAEINEQAALPVEDLDLILERVDHPDVAVAINGNALGSPKIRRTVAVLAEHADEIPIGIKDLHTIIEGVRDVNVAVFVQGHCRWKRKSSRIRLIVLLAGLADMAQQLVGVGVEDLDDIVASVHYVNKAVLRVYGYTARADQHVPTEHGFLLVLGAKYQDVAQLGVGDKQAVVVVHRQANDLAKVCLLAVADQLDLVLVLQVEDENRAYTLIARIDFPLRIDRQSIGANKLEGEAVNLDLVRGRGTGHTVHPGLFPLLGLEFGGIDLFAGKQVNETDARDLRRARPHDLADIEISLRPLIAWLHGRSGCGFLLVRMERCRQNEGPSQQANGSWRR